MNARRRPRSGRSLSRNRARITRYELDRSDGPPSFDQPPSGRWPALMASMAASRFARASPERSTVAATVPAANAWPGPSAKVPSGLPSFRIWSSQRGRSADLPATASRPATAMRTCSSSFACSWKKATAASTSSLSAIFSSPAARRPIEVVSESALPPGAGAKPPSARHERTYWMQFRTSGIEPPTYLRIRTAPLVVPSDDGRPGAGPKPPSGFWSDAT